MPLLGWEWGHQGHQGVLGCQGSLGVTGETWIQYCNVLLKTRDILLQTIAHEPMWTGPKLVPLLATRCLSLGALRGMRGRWGVVHLTKQQPDPQADDISCWPAVVPLLTSRCLYWWWEWGIRGLQGVLEGIGGYIWNMNTVYCKVLLKTQNDLLQAIAHELMWTGPKLVPLLATRCLSLGGSEGLGVLYIWQNSSLTHRLMTYYAYLQ